MARFELIFKEQDYGMRFFSDVKAPGRVAIADNSGDHPGNTDDGVLYVDPSRPMVLYVSAAGKSFYVNMGVVNQQGERFTSSCKVEGALFLLRWASVWKQQWPDLAELSCNVPSELMDLCLASRAEPKHNPTPHIRCPKCGNTDLSQMRFMEDVQSYRKIHGIDKAGVLVINDQECDWGDGDHSRMVCNAGSTPCLHEFQLPDEVDFRNQLEDQNG